ncbi:MAG: MBL fold metallo-hydrolase [Vicingaceae bacterium]
MKKILKMVGIALLSFVLIIILGVTLFLTFSPQFGKSPSKAQKQEFAKTDHYEDGKFVNRSASPMNIDIIENLKEFTKKAPERSPAKAIDPLKIDSAQIANHPDSSTQLIWFGHSTFLLQINGLKLLLDPMFGDVPSPHPFLGEKRYSNELPIEIENLPQIDAVIFSHDHYDHLDYKSVKKLKDKVDHFFVPLGLGSHLQYWGVAGEKIQELDWWQETQFRGLRLACTPARHFSGRGLFDRAATLWASWVIQSKDDNIYFSGDSGYDEHFKKIGEKYGPFDFAMLECGQYNEDWKYIHMMPEETAQAAVDLRAKLAMPIHWGAFTLAFHSWTDPVVRVKAKAKELGVNLITPQIGEAIELGALDLPQKEWWLKYVED